MNKAKYLLEKRLNFMSPKWQKLVDKAKNGIS